MNQESIYLRMPIDIQNIICSVHGWQIQRTRFNHNFYTLLEQVEKRLDWSDEQLLDYRDSRLQNFVQHCVRTVPYYRQLFQTYKLNTKDICTLNDLKNIPILTKETVQQNYNYLLSETIPPKARIITHTSGTTGGGLRFATTQSAIHEQWAIWWRYRRLHGLQPNTWCGYFGGRSVVALTQKKPPFWRYNLPGRQILFSAYHMSPDTLQFYIRELQRVKPPWLHGYPSLLALVAAYILEQRISLEYKPNWVTIGAENLLPQQASLIEQAFGVRPLQHYGMTEAVANFTQCKKGKLHVDEDFAATEFIPNPDGGYKVVGTNFTNLATPLLRYDVMDVVELDDQGCDCGLPGRVVHQVDGRREDYVVLRNGARLGRMDHIFKDMMAIREAQIYQNKPGSIEVRVVRNDTYNREDEEQLLKEFHKRVGSYADVNVVYVDHIERSATGKLRFVVSDIKEGCLVL